MPDGMGAVHGMDGIRKWSPIESCRPLDRRLEDAFAAELAQGAAFAAKARQKAGNTAPHVDAACEILCGCSAAEAAELTDLTLRDLPPDAELPAYEVWRERVRRRL